MKFPDAEYRRYAFKHWHDEGVIEVDPTARVSGGDDGAYVQAWIWVSNSDLEQGKEISCQDSQ